MISSWDEVEPGDVLVIRDPQVPEMYSWRLLVRRVVPGAAPDIAIVHGLRLKRDGQPARKFVRDEWALVLREIEEVIKK